jgi:hypothetical protein
MRAALRVGIALLVVGVSLSVAAQGNRPVAVNQSAEIHRFKNSGRVTVDTVTLNFFPENARVLGDPRKEGRQFVRVALTITNTSPSTFRVHFTSFSLLTSDGARHATTSLINRGNSQDRLATTTLEPNASVSGALYYEVSAKETLETMAVAYEGYEGTAKKEYRVGLVPGAAGAGATMTAPAPPPATAAPPAAAAPPATAAVPATSPPPSAAAAPPAAAAPTAAEAAPGASAPPGLVGNWAMDETKSKAAPDGDTAGLMGRLVMKPDGTFTALAGVAGTYTFDGKVLLVRYSTIPGEELSGGLDGEWLKFPAPAARNRFVYLKRSR